MCLVCLVNGSGSGSGSGSESDIGVLRMLAATSATLVAVRILNFIDDLCMTRVAFNFSSPQEIFTHLLQLNSDDDAPERARKRERGRCESAFGASHTAYD